jgi:predicted nucleic acid-binding protein
LTTFLVDNSIWQKAGRSEQITARLRELSSRDLIITCPPQVLEYCHSARNHAEYLALRRDMDELLPALVHPTAEQALDIQQALWQKGMMRAAGAFDCLIAAYSLVNDAVLLNCDHDFSHIERATQGALRQEYVPE